MFFDIVVARNERRVIGKNQSIPWRVPEDLKWFKHLTTATQLPKEAQPTATESPHVILGRRTWESLPEGRPLVGRRHWIVSNTLTLSPDLAPMATVVSSLQAALAAIRSANAAGSGQPRVCVIGGEALYAEALVSPWCRHVYETVVHQEVSVEPGDTLAYFPEIPQEYHRVRTGRYETSASGVVFHRDTWERKRPLLWWIDPSCYESDWLNLCLAKVPHYAHTPALSIVPNAILIANQLSQYRDVLTLYETHQVPYTLIHLSDEYLDDDLSCYSHAACQTVFRNYLHPVYFNRPKVIPFGIGYRNGFTRETPDDFLYPVGGALGARAADPEDRIFVWSFAGYIKKSDRTQILNLFKGFQPHAIHETAGFNQGILAPDDYAAVVRQSKFVLCPVGNCSIDTFRLYEALEAGAIPVTLSTNVNQPFVRFIADYWKTLFNTPFFLTDTLPWVMSHTWEENVVKMRALLADPEAFNDLRNRLAIIWKTYKTNLIDLFRRRLALNAPIAPPPAPTD